MAVYTSDTVEHDIVRSGTGEVMVFNLCTDTTRHINGIVTNMHPSEGVWLFRSKIDILEMLEVLELLAPTNIFFSNRGAARGNCFGSMFGNHKTCGAFPTCSPMVKRQQSIRVQDTEAIVRLGSSAARTDYMCFDEAYFKTLESMQWNRDNGCIELIPIVVGLP